jgi:hypothetical protein
MKECHKEVGIPASHSRSFEDNVCSGARGREPHGSDAPQGRPMVASTRPDRPVDHSHPSPTQHTHKHECEPPQPPPAHTSKSLPSNGIT